MPFSVATSAFDVLLCEFLVSVRVCVFVSLFLYTYTSLFWVLSKVFERLLCECEKKKKKLARARLPDVVVVPQPSPPPPVPLFALH